MKVFSILIVWLLGSLPAAPSWALSIEDFAKICSSAPVHCAEVPILQGYVGGALDLVATLDQETDYLDQIYCENQEELLRTAPIIEYILAHKEELPQRNAMTLVIQYLVDEGGC